MAELTVWSVILRWGVSRGTAAMQAFAVSMRSNSCCVRGIIVVAYYIPLKKCFKRNRPQRDKRRGRVVGDIMSMRWYFEGRRESGGVTIVYMRGLC